MTKQTQTYGSKEADAVEKSTDTSKTKSVSTTCISDPGLFGRPKMEKEADTQQTSCCVS